MIYDLECSVDLLPLEGGNYPRIAFFSVVACVTTFIINKLQEFIET